MRPPAWLGVVAGKRGISGSDDGRRGELGDGDMIGMPVRAVRPERHDHVGTNPPQMTGNGRDRFSSVHAIETMLRVKSANFAAVSSSAVDPACFLGDWLESMPDGLDTEVGQRGSQLSAGERQLVALVRASLVDPDVLVLDEATSSVDALTEVRLTRALDKLAQGRTTIAIAHRLSTAARADRVLVLEHGRLVQDGSHAELVAVPGAYARMYDAWVASTTSA